MMSIAQVRSAGSAGNYYTDKDNYYVLGSMGERWAGQGAEQLGLQGSVDKDVFTRLLEGRLPDGADLSRMQDGRKRRQKSAIAKYTEPAI
ncbi:conjugal transfer nickase/helicase TraI [Escherichia coli]|nr:relaxase domain-containing protein [Escherichia coli]SQZ20721.1 conjugal transfer nickase/helicase TraI [Escherichia coli]